jgi:hypothetical protein
MPPRRSLSSATGQRVIGPAPVSWTRWLVPIPKPRTEESRWRRGAIVRSVAIGRRSMVAEGAPGMALRLEVSLVDESYPEALTEGTRHR